MLVCKRRDCERARHVYGPYCKQCRSKNKLKKLQRAWYLRRSNGESLKAPHGSSSELKVEAIKAYGGKCFYCGQDEVSQLQLDHTKNNGHKHRLLISKGRAGIDFYRALKKLDFPKSEEYPMKVVCYDCHVTITTKRHYVISE